MNLCLIPARAGSKRIPNKNTRDFLGKPILEYPLNAALDSKLFRFTVISTDSWDIYNNYQPNAMWRTPENSSDTATLADVLTEVLDTGLYDVENVCVILPTAVFVKPDDLIRSFAMLRGKQAVMSVKAYRHPIERALRVDDYMVNMIMKEYQFYRTQDLPTAYHDAGQFYWINVEEFRKHKTFFMPKCGGYIIDSVDIDDESDWRRAEEAYRARGVLARRVRR